jgi:hypothetical protein
MSRNQIIALAAIAGLLAIVFIAQRAGEAPPDLEKEYGLKALAPERFLVSDVAKVELYRGSKEGEKVVLARDAEGWKVVSAYGAPGKKDDVDEFIRNLEDLAGEYRSDEASVLGDYQLADEQAIHVAAYKVGSEEVWFHLLVGKEEGQGRSFVRREGEDTVYTVNVNLASEMGLWGDDLDKVPESSHWVDKIVVDMEKDEIDRLAIETPDRSFVFEKREKKAEDKDEKDGEKEGVEDENKEKEHEWAVAQGGPGGAFKQSGIDSLLRALDKYEASDVVDPAKKKEYGLDKPGFRCTVRVAGDKETVLVASRKKPGEDAHLMVEGRDVVYKVADWKFNQVFSKGKDLFELKGLDEDEKSIQRLALAYPSAKLELVRKDGKWSVSSPSTGLEFKENEGEDAAKAAGDWTPEDYADGEDLARYGLDRPERTVTFALDDGKEHTIAIGAEARGVEGRYVLLDGGKRVLVVGKRKFEDMMPEPKELFEMDVADVKKDKIARIVVEREKAPFVLERAEGDTWRLTVAGEKVEPDKNKLESFLGRFSPVTASDIALKDTGTGVDAPEATVSLTATEGKGVVVRLGPLDRGNHRASVDGKPAALLFSASKAMGFAPPAQNLLDLAVADVPAGEITKVVVERDDDAFELAKVDDAWKLTVGGEEKECDSAGVDRYLRAFSRLRAADVSFGAEGLVPDDAKPVVTVTRKDKPALTLVIGKEHEGKVASRKKGVSLVYLLFKGRASQLAPASASLAAVAKETKEAETTKDTQPE